MMMECTEALGVDVDAVDVTVQGDSHHPRVGIPCCEDVDVGGSTCAADSASSSNNSSVSVSSPSVVSAPLTPASPDASLVSLQLAALLAAEARGRPAVNPNYIEDIHKGYLVPGYRKQIVDWMLEVGAEFCVTDTTSFAGVQLFDRFLSRQQVRPSELQMLALACVFIASKVNDSGGLKLVNFPCPRGCV